MLGVLWVAWHLPLFLTGQIELTDVPVVIAASVVIAGVFHLGRESVLIAMIMHATNNAVGGSYASQLFHGADLSRLGWFTTAAWWLLAITVMIIRRRHRGTLPAVGPSPHAGEPVPDPAIASSAGLQQAGR